MNVITSSSVVFMLCVFTNMAGAPPPPTDKPKAGPCIGMDCLHGILMHGDEEQGDNHKAEDQYNKFQEIDKLAADDKKNGPCVGMDCLHGVLMHQDEEQGKDHDHEDKEPRVENQVKKDGPCIGMECLHGVLMHGDEETGRSHKNEDAKLAAIKEAVLSGIGTVDIDELLHGIDENVHELSEDDADAVLAMKENAIRGGIDTVDMHGALHGGDTDAHKDKPADYMTKEELKDIMDKRNINLEAILHGGDAHAHDEDHDDGKIQEMKEQILQGSGVADLDKLLHAGDGNAHAEHNVVARDPRFRPSATNPDDLLHENDEAAHKIREDLKKDFHNEEDLQQYLRWKKEKIEMQNRGGGWLGFSLSDNVLSESIDHMKKRYLNGLFSTVDEDEDEEEEEEDVKSVEKLRQDYKDL